nr:hypothetical protein [Tanacetum cinerariifolium]
FELGKVVKVVESDWRGGGVVISGGEGQVRSGGKIAMNRFEKSLPETVCFWTCQFLMCIRHGELMAICCVVLRLTLKDPSSQQYDFKSN